MLAKTTLDPDQVKRAEELARRKWGPNALEPHFARLIEAATPAVAPLSRRTYLLAAAPQKEARVEKALRDAGLDVYLPRVPISLRVGHHERRAVMRPMLPGYVFPIFDEHRDHWQIIKRPDKDGRNGIDGVLRLFLWGERPVPIAESIVDRLHEREVEEQMRGSGGTKRTAAYVAMPGDVVRVDDPGSVWRGFIGEVVDLLARATLLVVELDIFGRKTPVEVPFDQVTAI